MPHIILKIAAGKSEAEKLSIAQTLSDALTGSLGIEEKSLSVAVEDIEVSDWVEKVFIPDIQAKPEQIYKKPGYDPFV